MKAEIVSIGTELLLGHITDTHAPTMARILAECGIGCHFRSTVGDNFERLVWTLRQALERSDIVVTIGGLGPTGDDLTREAIAAALDDTLELVPEIEEKLKAFFAARGVPYVESNSKQALKPTCAEIIPNPNGTAPGLVCRKNNRTVFALPGPKGEFDPMAYDSVKPMLEAAGGGFIIHSRTLRIIGVGESEVEHRLQSLMDQSNPTVAPYAHTGEVHLRLTARAGSVEEASRIIDPTEAQIRSILGSTVYGIDLETLEEVIIQTLHDRGETVSVAESITGGGIGRRLTSVSGSSKAFVGGAIAYTVDAKVHQLGIDRQLIEDKTPVSIEVAEALASGARDRFGSTFAVGVTGNAGPTSDIGQQPVGAVFIAVAGPDGVTSEGFKFRGIREDIRARTEQVALKMLRERVLSTK